MINFSDVATQMNICKVMAYALPRFYHRTGISAEFHFVHDPKSKEMNVTVGFANLKEPTDEHYSILLEEIVDAEKLLNNEYIINSQNKFENLKQFIFKHKEDTLQIVAKHKQHV